MIHEIHAIRKVQVIGPHALRLTFEDGLTRDVDLEGIFAGELYAPLADPDFFKQVRLNTDFDTVEWPNGADFDPETLYHWDEYRPAWQKAAEQPAAKRM